MSRELTLDLTVRTYELDENGFVRYSALQNYLEEGATRHMVRIPFSVSNLFEQGIHYPTVALTVDGQVAAADRGPHGAG